ncbi:MAG: gliding-motility protein MglA [Chloroflexi bacterium]|nr:MAG: gliding-motility protein MglA [Chloroflexota bacterium]MBL1194151.1 gliding-motility protein MglA [Chloroflexota bacterium]NOH11444.1 gliding-motility protein MglA [Chloroflexota bacterium]
MLINWNSRELHLKIVYCGPALSGKTTNLEFIHGNTASQKKSELISLKTQGDRTLFFDFMQMELEKISGLTPKIHLYTVPGQPFYETTRKLVLRGADGVVFVADSSRLSLGANIEAWNDMFEHLSSLELLCPQFPVVVQFNKQDLTTKLPSKILSRQMSLNGYPTTKAVALQGQGVFDTLKVVLNGVLQNIQKELVSPVPTTRE